jgi:hypothetical protein
MLPARIQLVEELYGLYGKASDGVTTGIRWRLFRKRVLWTSIISGATFAKRLLDILVSAVALLALSPLFAFVALAIKLTDRGPVLFWQTRVGQWGKRVRFSKASFHGGECRRVKGEADGAERS